VARFVEHIRITREGLGTILGLGLFAALFGYLSLVYNNSWMAVLGLITLLLFLLMLYFFRDPPRRPPDDAAAIVSPADGKVIEIATMDEMEFMEGTVRRISIYISLFDVHINYIPFDGVVDYARYSRGKYHRANTESASSDNVNTFVGILTKDGRMAFRQVAGILARRIICNLRFGDRVEKGKKFGMIKFGSRMELYLPVRTVINVRVGDQVRGAESIIAYDREK
jgi:phosphatidylserine decarboxylase